MKKIMISYASYGGGHLSAAKNLKEYIEKNYPDYEVTLFDCMRYVNRVIDKVCGTTYSGITKNIPWFWGKIYYHTQNPVIEKVLSLSNKILSFKLGRFLKKEPQDIIISTHFFVGHLFSILKERKKIDSILATIITDYGEDPYNEWISNHEYMDYIFVAHSEIKNKLIEKGISEEKVFDTGIPISDKFLKNYNKSEIFNNLDLDTDKKTILFFGGGELGLGKSKTIEAFEILVKNFPDIQIIAIAGKNEVLKNNFENIVKENNRQKNIKILGFTTQVAEFMSISDLVITKPGGLTTTEALVSNLPLVAINPIPGQEEENAKFLEQSKAGILIKNLDVLEITLKKLLYDPKKIEEMKLNIQKISKPNSTQNICNILL